MIFDLCEVEEKIKYTFQNKNLLRQAFTHSSYSNEQKGKSNEELEFLGDSILNFVVADYLYRKHPEWDEGELTKMRAGLVSATPLSEVIEGMDLTRHILLGVGESKLKTHSYNISADLFEAVTAAIYLDGGLEAARSFISMSLLSKPCNGKVIEGTVDCKSRLMELSQKLFKANVQYRLLSQTGPAHDPVFTVQAIVNGKPYAKASGKSKKAAEQQAAQLALEKLEGGAEDESVPEAMLTSLKQSAPSPSAYEWQQTRFDPSDDAFVDIYAEDFDRRGGRRSGRKPSVRAAFGGAGRSGKRRQSGKLTESERAAVTEQAESRSPQKRAAESKSQKQSRDGTRAGSSASATVAGGAKSRSDGKRGSKGGKGRSSANARSSAAQKDTRSKKPVRTDSAKPTAVGKKFALPRWLGKKA